MFEKPPHTEALPGLTPEEQLMLEMNAQLASEQGTAPYSEQFAFNPAGEVATSASDHSPDAIPVGSVAGEGRSPEEAVDWLAALEGQALRQVTENTSGNNPSVKASAEKAMRDPKIEEAREAVRAIYGGGDATRVETTALEKAINDTTSTQVSHAIAESLINGTPDSSRSGEVAISHLADGYSAQENRLKLDDKLNGQAPDIVRRIAEQAGEDLAKVGVKENAQALGEGIVAAYGPDITSPEDGERAISGTVGADVIDALAGNTKPKANRATLQKLLENVKGAHLHELVQAVSRRMSGSTITRQTAQSIGSIIKRSHKD